MNPWFPEIKKNFGFGFMRLPMIEDKVDIPHTIKMVDAFMDAGFNYFDTAHGYINGQSETALRECLTSRYPRDRYVLTNKLSGNFFETEEQIRPLIQEQLEKCGVEYFDILLMHGMNRDWHQRYLERNAYDVAQALKAEGKIRHMGISFHDSPEVLDKILTDRPEIEVVQIQYNYVDFEDPNVQSNACYQVCRKHGKPVIIMEPVKGGSLINLPPKALELLKESPAYYALRYAGDPEGVVMVLSGMSTLEQVEDNNRIMGEFRHLSDEEKDIIDRVRTIYQGQHRIPCTTCRYCEAGCPAEIPIPDLFTAMNEYLQKKSDDTSTFSKAADCLECGKCEEICPQHLHIRELLKDVAATK